MSGWALVASTMANGVTDTGQLSGEHVSCVLSLRSGVNSITGRVSCNLRAWRRVPFRRFNDLLRERAKERELNQNEI